MKTRKITAFLLICTLMASMLSFTAAALAATDVQTSDAPIEIAPLWINTMNMSCNLSSSGRTITCVGNITALSGSTISGTLTLQRQNGSSWEDVTSWSRNSTTALLNFNETHTVNRAGTYRVVLSGTVTRNGVSESVSLTSNERIVN